MYQWFKVNDVWHIGVALSTKVRLVDQGIKVDLSAVVAGPFIREPSERPKVDYAFVIEDEVKQDVLDDPGDLFVHESFKEFKGDKANDCAVVCIANILQIPYSEARVKAFHAGWSSTKGITSGLVEAFLKREGLGLRFVNELVRRAPDEVLSILPEKSIVVVGQSEHIGCIINRKPLNLSTDLIKDAYFIVEGDDE